MFHYDRLIPTDFPAIGHIDSPSYIVPRIGAKERMDSPSKLRFAISTMQLMLTMGDFSREQCRCVSAGHSNATSITQWSGPLSSVNYSNIFACFLQSTFFQTSAKKYTYLYVLSQKGRFWKATLLIYISHYTSNTSRKTGNGSTSQLSSRQHVFLPSLRNQAKRVNLPIPYPPL